MASVCLIVSGLIHFSLLLLNVFEIALMLYSDVKTQ